jgi:hypothetical protein
MPKLNQIVAIEKGIKSRVEKSITDLKRALEKTGLFVGFVKTYRPKSEGDETYPSEQQKVQMRAEETLAQVANQLTELFDISAARDYANMTAKADVVLESGQILIEGAPVPYLLFLEKQINDIRTIVQAVPVLDDAEHWTLDQASELYKTAATAVHRTKKTQKGIVLYDATKEHPAQTQLITDDVVAGYWEVVKHSGGVPTSRKRTLLERIEALSKAVKFAREAANAADAPKQLVGKRVFDYLLE